MPANSETELHELPTAILQPILRPSIQRHSQDRCITNDRKQYCGEKSPNHAIIYTHLPTGMAK